MLVASSGREFEVDRVFSPHDHDGGSVHSEVASLVSSLYDGFNATVFAYGASGAGKTHTVLGGKHSPGLVDNIIEDVFARYNERTCTVQLSVEELYCVSVALSPAGGQGVVVMCMCAGCVRDTMQARRALLYCLDGAVSMLHPRA